MEPATILVVVLIAGVIALLVWFELNSRRNEARQKREIELGHQAKRDREATAGTESKDTAA
jgi:type II secretory pathway pseudopilin PulG